MVSPVQPAPSLYKQDHFPPGGGRGVVIPPAVQLYTSWKGGSSQTLPAAEVRSDRRAEALDPDLTS